MAVKLTCVTILLLPVVVPLLVWAIVTVPDWMPVAWRAVRWSVVAPVRFVLHTSPRFFPRPPVPVAVAPPHPVEPAPAPVPTDPVDAEIRRLEDAIDALTRDILEGL